MLIVGGVSEWHPDGGRWEGGVVLWFYEVALKDDKINIVHAWLTHAAWVLMHMAGTVEVPDCSGLTCTHSCLTLCLTPCPHLSLCPHPMAHRYARYPSLSETHTGHAQTEWVHAKPVPPIIDGVHCV